MEIKPIKVTQGVSDVRDVLMGTMETRDYYGDIEVACGGVGGAACKMGCISGCKESSKSGIDCRESCKESCADGCKKSCKGGNK